MFKNVKRTIDLKIDLEIENKIPRLDFIEMMEDSYEISIIEYLSNEFTKNLLQNPEEIKKMISDKIRKMVSDSKKGDSKDGRIQNACVGSREKALVGFGQKRVIGFGYVAHDQHARLVLVVEGRGDGYAGRRERRKRRHACHAVGLHPCAFVIDAG